MTQDGYEDAINYTSHTCGHARTGLFRGFPRLQPCERNVSVDGAGRRFQPHSLGNAKNKLSLLIEAFLHHNLGQEPSSLVISAEIRAQIPAYTSCSTG